MRVDLDELLYLLLRSFANRTQWGDSGKLAYVEDGDAQCATCPALADEVLLANRRLKSMPRSAPQAVSRAPAGQNWKARNPLLPPFGEQLAKSRSPVDRDGSF